MSKQTNENPKGDFFDATARRILRRMENNDSFRRFMEKIIPVKDEIIAPIGDGQQYLQIPLQLKRGGTYEFAKTRTISQKKAQKLLSQKKSIEERLLGLKGRVKRIDYIRDGKEWLSATDAELVDTIIKQANENSAFKKLELPKEVTAQNADDALKSVPRSTISDSIKRIRQIRGKISALNAGKNTKSQQYQKPAQSSKTSIKYVK